MTNAELQEMLAKLPPTAILFDADGNELETVKPCPAYYVEDTGNIRDWSNKKIAGTKIVKEGKGIIIS